MAHKTSKTAGMILEYRILTFPLPPLPLGEGGGEGSFAGNRRLRRTEGVIGMAAVPPEPCATVRVPVPDVVYYCTEAKASSKSLR